MNNLQDSLKRGSLLVIFLFTTGLLAILVTGLYFVISVGGIQQNAVENYSAWQRVASGCDQVLSSEISRLTRNYIANGLQSADFQQGDATTPGTYTYALCTALKWAFNEGTLKEASQTVPGGLEFIAWPTFLPLLDRGNTFSTSDSIDDFGAHPLSFLPWATEANGGLVAEFTPTWSDRPFTYERAVVFYREVPVCFLPLSVAYTPQTEFFLRGADVAGGPEVIFDIAGSGSASQVRPAIGEPTSAPYQPEMVSSYGMDPEDISSGTALGGTIASRQQYVQDAEVVLLFNGTAVSVEGGGTVPSGVTVGSFDGRSRVIVDLGASYSNEKYFIKCLGASDADTVNAKAAGVVLFDDGTYSSGSTFSWATDGMLNLHMTAASPFNEPIVAATSYGAVGLSDDGYNGTSATAALDFDFCGALSAYTKKETVWEDTFARATDPSSSLLDGSAVGSVCEAANANWGAGNSGLSCNGSGVLSGNGYCQIPIGYQAYGGGLIGFLAEVDLSSGSTFKLRLFSGSFNPSTTASMDFSITTNGSTFTAGYQYTNALTGMTYDQTSATASDSAGGQASVLCLYAPGLSEVFMIVNGEFLFKKKMTTIPSLQPTQMLVQMTSGAQLDKICTYKNPLGTLLASPQAEYGTSCEVSFYGGVAVGEGFVSSLKSDANVNFVYENAVGETLGNYCERVIVHYPYFY